MTLNTCILILDTCTYTLDTCYRKHPLQPCAPQGGRRIYMYMYIYIYNYKYKYPYQYKYIYIYIAKRGAFRWLVAAGWSLLLCDWWLVTCSGTFFGYQEGLWRALGGLWDGHGMARAGARLGHDGHGRCWAAHE